MTLGGEMPKPALRSSREHGDDACAVLWPHQLRGNVHIEFMVGRNRRGALEA
jgi:hypothetical protein